MNKQIIGFCVMLAFLSMPLAFLVGGNSQPFVGYTVELVGQETATVGELCRFLAEGEIVRWECLPQTSDSESYGDHNENFVVSFRAPGIYTVIAAIYKEGDLSIHSQPVTVDGVRTDPTVPIPTILNTELAMKVKGWAQKYKVPKETCIKLASNFNQVASQISAGTLKTPSEIISTTAEMNQDLTLDENLMAELQAYLTSQSDIGNLKTPEQHKIVWQSIAKGLLDATT